MFFLICFSYLQTIRSLEVKCASLEKKVGLVTESDRNRLFFCLIIFFNMLYFCSLVFLETQDILTLSFVMENVWFSDCTCRVLIGVEKNLNGKREKLSCNLRSTSSRRYAWVLITFTFQLYFFTCFKVMKLTWSSPIKSFLVFLMGC